MIAQPTFADLVRPSAKRSALLYDTGAVIGGAALIGLCTQLAFGGPVPFTGQTFAVLLTGAVLGSRRGVASVLTYIAAGLAGFPVFAQGKTGWMVLAGPTAGFLLGFIPAAFLVGALAEKGWDRRAVTTALAMIAGDAVLFSFGLAWLSLAPVPGLEGLRTRGVLTVGFYPFVPGEILKIALATALLPSTWRFLGCLGVDKTAKVC